jgi:hypothetical protein
MIRIVGCLIYFVFQGVKGDSVLYILRSKGGIVYYTFQSVKEG